MPKETPDADEVSDEQKNAADPANAVEDATPPSAELVELAESYGVASEYWSFFGERVHVPATTLRRVLTAMRVDVGTEAEVADALAAKRAESWRRFVPPSLVVREGGGELPVVTRHDAELSLEIVLEDGERRELPVAPRDREEGEHAGHRVNRLTVPLPADLPLGWHTVVATDRVGDAERTASCVVVVTPERLPDPPTRPDRGRGWGLMAQLYSARSRQSWGIGDFADLGDLAAIAGGRGADFLLVNPVHAAEVTPPIEPSPYLPATRRFLAPLYLRPEDVREAAYLPASGRALLDAERAQVSPADIDPDTIDRDAAWAAKRAALEAVFAVPRSAARQGALDGFVAREGQSLADFALWCALEEHYAGGAERPAEASDPSSRLVGELRDALAPRIAFYSWLQWVADEQLGAAQAAAHAAGMRIGVMHDLAVGVHPSGSDVWSLGDLYARGISVGAPPDMYNQQGQDWSQPPWLPTALAEVAYAPLRDMIRSLLRHAGALRIDHVIGLFRLWWIPSDLGPTAGTYVRYDHEAMIGVLLLEAHRAGAVVIGEDLGNVEPWVRDYLTSRGVLGTSVLWFEYEGDGFKPPEHWRRSLLATVNTHDLPPTAGYLAGEQVELRERLGLLTESVDEARAQAADEKNRMLGQLYDRGLLYGEPNEQETVEALHVLVTKSPSVLVGVALVDAVGERRTQNQPGTYDQYPNWRVPLAGPDGQVVLVEDLASNERFRSLTRVVDEALRGTGGR